MKKSTLLITLVIGALWVSQPSYLISQSLFSSEIKAEKVGSKITVTIDGEVFTQYIFSQDEKYPFFFPVNGPLTGGSVTSMRNHPYPHHSSLFLACDRVNGGNYWQEGLERGRIISVNAEILKQGGDSVVITDECIWSRPGAISPLKDTRRITITTPSENIRQIDFEITLNALTDVTFGNTGHSLFSARMAPDLIVSNGGTIINAQGGINEKGTREKRTNWIDYFGKRGSGVEGLAIMPYPSNPWNSEGWFTRDYGFFSPDPMFLPPNGENRFMEKGDEILLRYRVLVHSGNSSEAKIAEAFEKLKNEIRNENKK